MMDSILQVALPKDRRGYEGNSSFSTFSIIFYTNLLDNIIVSKA